MLDQAHSVEQEIITQLKRIFDRVNVGELTSVQAGASITHLNFYPGADWDEIRLSNPNLSAIVEDLAPDLEIENGDPSELWSSISAKVDKLTT